MQDGSLLDLIQRLGSHRGLIAAVLVAIPALSWIIGLLLKRASRKTAANFLAVPIFLTVPLGTIMACVLGYLVFIVRENVLAYDAVLLFGPVLSMALTLFAVSKVLPFDEIPGFDRLSGLMLVAAVAFIIVYLLDRFALRLFFVASLPMLALIFIALFVLLRIGLTRLAN